MPTTATPSNQGTKRQDRRKTDGEWRAYLARMEKIRASAAKEHHDMMREERMERRNARL